MINKNLENPVKDLQRCDNNSISVLQILSIAEQSPLPAGQAGGSSEAVVEPLTSPQGPEAGLPEPAEESQGGKGKAGYEYLLANKITVPIYDYTVEFCERCGVRGVGEVREVG